MSILASNYNSSFNTIGFILSSKFPTGITNVSGYGITSLASRPVTTSTIVTVNQWKDLAQDLNKIYRHQNNVDWPNLSTVLSLSSSTVISNAVSGLISSALPSLTLGRYTVHPGQLTTSTVYSTTSTSAPWNGTLQSLVSFTWDTPEEVNYFFNSGGSLEFRPTHRNDVGNSQGQYWKNFLSTVTSNFIYNRSNYINSNVYTRNIVGTSSTQYTLQATKITNGIEFTLQFINSTATAADLTVENNIVMKKSTDVVVGTYPSLTFQTNLDGSGVREYSFPKTKLNVFLNGESFGANSIYETYPDVQSSFKKFIFENIGNLPLTITDILFSTEGNVVPITNYNESWGDFPNNPVIIEPGDSLEFELAYICSNVGRFSNNFIVKSNNDNGDYYFNVRQFISQNKDFIANPSEVIKTINNYGESYIETINLITTQPLVPEYEAEFSGNTAYSIFALNTNSVEVLFDANEINNVNGVYTATLLLTSIGAENTVMFETTVDIATTNTNLASWVSAASPDNSIVGISLDIINGQTYLTIGVGLGADGSSYYDNETGYQFADLENLGYKGSFSTQPYTFWSTVYRIPLESSPKTYYSKDYQVKSSDLDYGYYFGSETQPGSMFIIQDDGYHNVFITLNSLREIPDDESLIKTLNNLTRTFYYYSSVDLGTRYYQLAPAINGGANTYYFKGFDSTGEVITTIVDVP